MCRSDKVFILDDGWVDFYLNMAIMYSTCSKDPSTQVGCVLVDEKRRPIGWGTNGLSRYSSDSKDILNNREEKYKRVLHAEENAIFNAAKSTEGATAFITHPPCLHCCHVLSQNGIVRVVTIRPQGEFAERWNLKDTDKELKDLGIEFNAYGRISNDPLINANIQFCKLHGNT